MNRDQRRAVAWRAQQERARELARRLGLLSRPDTAAERDARVGLARDVGRDVKRLRGSHDD